VSYSAFRQVRSRGLGKPGSEVPNGFGGCTVANGSLVFKAKAGENPLPNIQRSEAAGFPLTRFGIWRMRMAFRIPTLFEQQAAILSLSAQADADDVGIHNAPISFYAQGDVIHCVKRCDPLRQSVAQVDTVVLGSAQFVPGRDLLIDLSVNLTWDDTGHIHATLWDADGYKPRRLAADHGGNCYNDVAPPFPCIGVYSWTAGDPLEMRVSDFSVM
jgi:hypothetical protein